MKKFIKGILELDKNVTDLEAYEKPKVKKLDEIMEWCKSFNVEILFGTADDNTYLCEYRIVANTKALCNGLFRELKRVIARRFSLCQVTLAGKRKCFVVKGAKMENLNAEQVKKALECCASPEYKCEECPIDQKKKDDCVYGQFLAQNALALINSQEQRIAELSVELDAMRGAANSYKMHYEELTAELDEAKENFRRKSADYVFLSEKLREIVAEKKRLTEENEAWQKQLIAAEEQASKAYYNLACEVEGLRAENERLRASSVDYRNIPDIIAEARADTVRKMHSEIKERCIKGGIYPAFVARTIEQIAKEMLEGV